MFTINHVEYNGHESVRTAKGTSYDPGPGRSPVSSCGRRQLVAFEIDGTPESAVFTGGVVYVMNASGKTVAKYDLDSTPPAR